MQVKFILGNQSETVEVPDNLTDSEIQHELRQWVLDNADFHFEIEREQHVKI